MASTNSTANLRLNQWIGSDKPKMADFNEDNRKLDEAVSAHIADTAVHPTAAERQTWTNAAPLFGSYVGNGEPVRTVELGFKPSFGILFAADKNIVQPSGQGSTAVVFSAFISKDGCSQGAYIIDSGFEACSQPTAVANRIACLNEPEVTYLYMMFR